MNVEIRGEGRSYKAVTGKYGEFKIHVPPGRYVVHVQKNGWEFETDGIMTFEDPENIRIEDGGCAQVQFVASTTKQRDRRDQ